MARTRNSKKMSTKKKAALGIGGSALGAGLGYGAYKYGPGLYARGSTAARSTGKTLKGLMEDLQGVGKRAKKDYGKRRKKRARRDRIRGAVGLG